MAARPSALRPVKASSAPAMPAPAIPAPAIPAPASPVIIATSRHASQKLQKQFAYLAFEELLENDDLPSAQSWVELHQLTRHAYEVSSTNYPTGWNRVGRESYIMVAIEKALVNEYPVLDLETFLREPVQDMPESWRYLVREFDSGLIEDLSELPESRKDDYVVVWARVVRAVKVWKVQGEPDLVECAEEFFEEMHKVVDCGGFDEGDLLILRCVRARVVYGLGKEMRRVGHRAVVEDCAVFSAEEEVVPKSPDATVSW